MKLLPLIHGALRNQLREERTDVSSCSWFAFFELLCFMVCQVFFFLIYSGIVDLQYCVSFCCIAEIQLYICIHSFSYSFPLWFITGYWILFPVLYSKTFLFIHPVYKGSPTPQAIDRYWWPIRNPAAQQEVSSSWASATSPVFTAAPRCSHYHLSSAFCQISGNIRFS